jgi:hypothetical protein
MIQIMIKKGGSYTNRFDERLKTKAVGGTELLTFLYRAKIQILKKKGKF